MAEQTREISAARGHLGKGIARAPAIELGVKSASKARSLLRFNDKLVNIKRTLTDRGLINIYNPTSLRMDTLVVAIRVDDAGI